MYEGNTSLRPPKVIWWCEECRRRNTMGLQNLHTVSFMTGEAEIELPCDQCGHTDTIVLE